MEEEESKQAQEIGQNHGRSPTEIEGGDGAKKLYQRGFSPSRKKILKCSSYIVIRYIIKVLTNTKDTVWFPLCSGQCLLSGSFPAFF